jgi:hypothetical protein
VANEITPGWALLSHDLLKIKLAWPDWSPAQQSCKRLDDECVGLDVAKHGLGHEFQACAGF